MRSSNQWTMDSDESRALASSPLIHAAVQPDESVVVTIVRTLAAVENVEVTALPPLSERIDPEALDTLVSRPTFTGTVTFEYFDYVVHVEAGESVTVYGDAPDDGRPRADRTR